MKNVITMEKCSRWMLLKNNVTRESNRDIASLATDSLPRTTTTYYFGTLSIHQIAIPKITHNSNGTNLNV
jgi:hypothetical protein